MKKRFIKTAARTNVEWDGAPGTPATLMSLLPSDGL
jgi:hypothetical protein